MHARSWVSITLRWVSITLTKWGKCLNKELCWTAREKVPKIITTEIFSLIQTWYSATIRVPWWIVSDRIRGWYYDADSRKNAPTRSVYVARRVSRWMTENITLLFSRKLKWWLWSRRGFPPSSLFKLVKSWSCRSRPWNTSELWQTWADKDALECLRFAGSRCHFLMRLGPFIWIWDIT